MQSCPWNGMDSTLPDPRVGLCRVEILQFSMGWIGSNDKSTVIYFLMIRPTQHTTARDCAR